jgi:poly(A) polymerase
MVAEAKRLCPPQIAYERIREEFVKIALLPGRQFRLGMELLLESGLLAQFLPEMLPMLGCLQGSWHPHDVWEHTLTALEKLPQNAPLSVRLGLLWHDIGKPGTRFEDSRGVHFYGHPATGALLVHEMMARLKFSNDEIRDTVDLIKLHMRLGEYRPEWDDPAVKRLIRDIFGLIDELFMLTMCDQEAVSIPEDKAVDLSALRARIDRLISAVEIESPLNGNEIMQLLGVGQGPHLKLAKVFLINAVIDGKLSQQDTAAAGEMLRAWWAAER